LFPDGKNDEGGGQYIKQDSGNRVPLPQFDPGFGSHEVPDPLHQATKINGIAGLWLLMGDCTARHGELNVYLEISG
jgi:hypothetical protein